MATEHLLIRTSFYSYNTGICVRIDTDYKAFQRSCIVVHVALPKPQHTPKIENLLIAYLN